MPANPPTRNFRLMLARGFMPLWEPGECEIVGWVLGGNDDKALAKYRGVYEGPNSDLRVIGVQIRDREIYNRRGYYGRAPMKYDLVAGYEPVFASEP
jgi:hypothetical protein